MKRFFTILWCVLLSTLIYAQAPNMMDFQSLVRDASGNFVSNQTIGVRISILQGSATGTEAYAETHQVATNANGLLTLTIGAGATTGNLASVDWANGPYFIKTEMDIAGGTNYTLVQTTQMMSVPYAMYAAKAGNVVAMADLEERLAALEQNSGSMSGNMKGNVVIEDGAIKAAFSISDSTKIYFSQGNLQYTQSKSEWSFSENQYDVIGASNVSGSSLADKVDLFYYSQNTSSSKFGVTYKCPTLTTTSSGYLTLYVRYYSFLDWGVNPIINGGNTANLWRTMTASEWKYIYTSRPNAPFLRFKAIINGVQGLVLLPDNFMDITFGSPIRSINYDITSTLTKEQWLCYQSYGAVFLPYPGRRLEGGSYSMYDPTSGAYTADTHYWTSSIKNDFIYSGYSVTYYDGIAVFRIPDIIYTVDNNKHRSLDTYYALPVRLVRAAE